jgi:hypothetical protein
MLKRFSLIQLQSQLLKVSAPQPIGLTAIHEPAMRRTNNPFRGRVLKRSRVNGWINFEYKRTVRRQQVREHLDPDFQPMPRVWGQRVRDCPLVLHADETGLQLYLEVKLQTVERLYFDSNTFEPIDAKSIAPFLIKRRPSRQPVQNQIELRDYRLDRVAQLRIGRDTWEVAPVIWLARNLGLK